MPIQQRRSRRHQLRADVVEKLARPAQVGDLSFEVGVFG